MVYKVLQKNNKKLRIISEPILEVNSDIRKLSQEMINTMKKENGIGLAAPQIGKNIRLIIVEIDDKPVVMINPRIIEHSEETVLSNESCLSVKGLSGIVERHKTVNVFYRDLNWYECFLSLSNMESNCVQHEIDHLDGILYIDKLV